MNYDQVVHGTFLRRLNRFVAEAEIGGRVETVHVKNTGRLKELLVPGATVSLEISPNAARKTRHSLIAVKKGKGWVNIDSQVPNDVVQEAILGGSVRELARVDVLKREAHRGDSRFDFYFESGEKRGFVEVKGVTLEKGGTAMFPDAPTVRGTKHVLELAKAAEEGYAAMVLFLIQMRGCRLFRPNESMDAAFADALRIAARRGVAILAYDTRVSDAEIEFGDPVEVDIG